MRWKVLTDKKYLSDKLREKTVLIAAHQGTFGGNICTNTISSGKNALLHGADIIEADVTRDKNGVLYMFHDAHEKFNFGSDKHIPEMTTEEVSKLRGFNANGDRRAVGVDRLDDYLKYFKDKDCIINLDRCWNIWDDVNELVKKYDMFDRIIYKSPADKKYYEFVKNCKYPMIYMPIVSKLSEADEALMYGEKTAGFEILYKTDGDDLCSDKFIGMCRERGLILWSNSIVVNDVDILSAGHDDNAIIEKGRDEWKWQFSKGFDIIQTDWPALWFNFRKEYFEQVR